MDVFPVTNRQYCEFLNHRKPDAKSLTKWIDLGGKYEKEKCRISLKNGKFIFEKGYEEYPDFVAPGLRLFTFTLLPFLV